jgi:Saccharopine dehydrogenase NADP binding domain
VSGPIAVFGASGHTGRFVASELRRRGRTPILIGRDAAKLSEVGRPGAGIDVRVASIDDPESVDHALSGAAAVVNCAGPFLDTAVPVVEAALRVGIHYLDVTAEQRAALAVFERFGEAGHDADTAIVPAMAFYGGLSDLLATAALGESATAEEIRIGVALDSWEPTSGTRVTGQRNVGRRFVVSKGRLEFLADPPPTREWDFPAPFRRQTVVGLPFSEIITISQHVQAREVHSYMNLEPIENLRDPNTPAPTAADESGRSAQTFLVDVIVRVGGEERRRRAGGTSMQSRHPWSWRQPNASSTGGSQRTEPPPPARSSLRGTSSRRSRSRTFRSSSADGVEIARAPRTEAPSLSRSGPKVCSWCARTDFLGSTESIERLPRRGRVQNGYVSPGTGGHARPLFGT